MDVANALVDKFIADGSGSLPNDLRPKKDLPNKCIMQLMVHKVGSNKYDVIKQYYFEGGLSTVEAMQIPSGTAETQLWREGQGVGVCISS